MIRRHLRSLKTSGFIQFEPWLLGRDTGRPENLAVPTKRGLRALNLAGAPIEERCYPHQYLLNWCQIRLRSLNCTDLQLSYEPLPFMPLSVSGHQLVPDLAFTLYSHELDKRLLFFLEMDMGTESLASPTRRTGDLRQKIELYREYFMASHYRSISSPASPLNGFRILFVLAEKPRL